MRQIAQITITVVLSVAIVLAIVFAVGVKQTANAVAEAGFTAFAAVGMLTAVYVFIQALSWAILNRPIKHRVRFRTLLEASVVGLAGNILTPSTFFGGEPLKIIYVARAASLPFTQVAGTVLLGKYLEGISFVLFFSFSVIGATVSYSGLLFGPYLAVGIAILIIGAVLLSLSAVLWLSLSRRWRPLTLLVRTLRRMPLLSRRLVNFERRLRQMELQVSLVFWEQGWAARQAFAAQMVGHVMIFLKPALFFYLGARLKLDLGPLCLLFVVGQALLLFQVTPSGAGTLDTGLMGAFALIGLDEPHHLAKCMAFLLCLRFWDLLIIGAGALLGAREGAKVLSLKPAGPILPQSPLGNTRPLDKG